MSAYLFYIFNIDLLLIPPHTSHILSPFDIALASPIKTYFSQELTKFEYKEELFEGRKFLTFLRKFVIKAFLNSADKSCTTNNIQSGFERAGMHPYQPDKPLFSDFSMENEHHLFQNKADNSLPTFFINSEEGLAYLYKKEYNKDISTADLTNSLNDIYDLLKEKRNIEIGIPLSKLPDILIENGNYYRRLKVPVPK